MNKPSGPRACARVSSYVLTQDSERYLERLLGCLAAFSDEIIVVDGGSVDATLAIARSFGCRIVQRTFDDFRSQREVATAQCTGEYVFYCDSDEVPSAQLVEWMQQMKRAGFASAFYAFRRNWYAFGRRVHSFYPIRRCPDRVVRLARRDLATYRRSRRVHERYDGCAAAVTVDAAIDHYSIDTDSQLERKLDQYSALAARDIANRRSRSVGSLRLRCAVDPPAAFLKFYLLSGGFLDGRIGWRLARYAARYTRLKYARAYRQVVSGLQTAYRGA